MNKETFMKAGPEEGEDKRMGKKRKERDRVLQWLFWIDARFCGCGETWRRACLEAPHLFSDLRAVLCTKAPRIKHKAAFTCANKVTVQWKFGYYLFPNITKKWQIIWYFAKFLSHVKWTLQSFVPFMEHNISKFFDACQYNKTSELQQLMTISNDIIFRPQLLEWDWNGSSMFS